MSAYTDTLRTKYDGIRTAIDGIQARAVDEGRDLSNDELRSIADQTEVAKGLATQIEDLTEIEVRNAKVAATASTVVETRTSGTTAKDRDPGFYTRNSENSFFGDLYAARQYQDQDAAGRLAQHNRALATGSAGAGVVAPRWLTEEFQELARQGRRVASAVRNVPINSANALVLPKQTTGTDGVITEQAAEGATTPATDEWASTSVTVTPKLTAGIQIVTRQMLDSSNPAIDLLIYGDMVAAYNQKIEAKVVAAMKASAGTAVVSLADEDAFALNGAGADALLDTAIAVRVARKLPADIAVMGVARYGEFLKLKDSTNRPLVPLGTNGPVNVVGVGSVAVDGQLHGLGVIATDGIVGTYPDSVLVARASDILLFESPVHQFSYEQPLGPEQVKLGIYAYSAVHVKYAGDSVKQFDVTAADAV